MPAKKYTSSSRKNSPQRDTNRMIQRIALAVILLVAAGVVWALVSGRDKTPTTGSANPTAGSAGETPKLIGTKTYDAAPPVVIDTGKEYTATVKMEKGGEFVIQLYDDQAPITVNSFVFLAREGFFDGVTFHRVLEGFMAQGGDPTGTGMSGPGYEFVNEDSELKFDKPGVVAMANAGRDTNGSQFFITFAPVPQLNGGYTIFGQVTEGLEVVNAITRRDPDQRPTFEGDKIASITITEQ